MESSDLLLTDARIATMRAGGGGAYGAIEDGALAIRNGKIAWVGPRSDLPAQRVGRPIMSSGARRAIRTSPPSTDRRRVPTSERRFRRPCRFPVRAQSGALMRPELRSGSK